MTMSPVGTADHLEIIALVPAIPHPIGQSDRLRRASALEIFDLNLWLAASQRLPTPRHDEFACNHASASINNLDVK
jgi:hypothetical protein